MKTRMQQFWSDQRGSTAMEYALIAVLISVVSIAAWNAIGQNVFGWFEDVSFASGGASEQSGDG